MDNDLISRDALKKTIIDNGYSHYYEIFAIIDNASPEETGKIEYKTYNEGFKDGVEQGIKLSERPQGEWIIDGHHRRCNYCNEYTCTEDREGNSIPDNFCPNCGADMRGNK